MRRYLAAIILSFSVCLAQGMDVGRTTLNMKYGLVVCDTLPLMGWQLNSSSPHDMQTAWRVQIFDRDSGKKVFDSNKREETASQLVSCGAKLSSGSYVWRVRVWDNKGKSSRWSSPHPFILATADQAFGASRWIGAITRRDAHLPTGRNYTGAILKDPAVKAAWAAADTLSRRSIILERDFRLEKKIRNAVVHICGLGFYHLFVNGKQVGENYFAPSWSNYDKTVFFNTFDITESLNSRAGNHLEVLLGNGFYNEQGGRYRKLLVSYGPPTLRLRLSVAYADGTTEQIVSDGKWTYRLSPITFNSIYGGEDYDARLEDIVTRRAVVVQEPPTGVLRPQEAYGVRIHEIFPASRRVSSSRPVFDMGQNLSGFPEIVVRGHRGDTVRLIVSEVLNADSLCDQRQTGRPHYYQYVLKGGGEEIWHPRFSYYGFQYVQVEGAVMLGDTNPHGLPVIEQLKSCFVYDSSPSEAYFHCSNPLFNDTHRIIVAAMKSNMQSVFTDCPHREKLGWLEQDYLNGEGLVSNFDLAGMIRQEMRQIADAQRTDGSVPTTAPEYVLFEGKGVDMFAESPEWGMAYLYLPFLYWRHYGDASLLYQYYDGMRAYVDYLQARTHDGILDMGLGDWYDYVEGEKAGFAKNTPRDYVGTCHLLMMYRYMARAALLTGHDADATRYTMLAGKTKESIVSRFYNTSTHSFSSGSQCANSIALVLGLMPEEDRHAVLQRLVDDIHLHHDRLTTGDVGNRFLYLALLENGQDELFYKMVNHHEVPGYGYQLLWGATTLTEQWDPRMGSSRNHFMMGQIEEVFRRYIAGIQFVSAHEIIVSPHPMGDLDSATYTMSTLYGPLTVHWEKSPEWKVKIDAPIGLKVTNLSGKLPQ